MDTPVVFMAKGNGAVPWYRCVLPAMALGAGWAVMKTSEPDFTVAASSCTAVTGLADLFDCEVVVLQQPVGAAWERAIHRLRRAGVTVLYEIDDSVHAVRKMRDHEFAKSITKQTLRDYERCMRAADGLLVSTEWLGARLATFNPDVWVCRNGVDLKRYALTRPARDTVNVGWAGGTGHREAIRPWLAAVADVMRAEPATRFVTVGQGFARELAPEFGPVRTLAVPFAPLDTYPASMTLFDVALAPAGKGNFFRAKSDLRWLEASALGIPVIADPGVYPEIEHGVTGFHAESPDEVRELLATLVADPALRRSVGEAARAHVSEHRSIAATSADWSRALREAVAGPVARAEVA